MTTRILKLAAFPVVSIALFSGCATTSAPARLAYYKVPCGTPGAVSAEPIVVDPASAPPQTSSEATGPAAPTCIVALSNDVRGYRGYGGYPGYYGRPYFGSVGIGFGFGSHGGHHRGHSGSHGGHARGH